MSSRSFLKREVQPLEIQFNRPGYDKDVPILDVYDRTKKVSGCREKPKLLPGSAMGNNITVRVIFWHVCSRKSVVVLNCKLP